MDRAENRGGRQRRCRGTPHTVAAGRGGRGSDRAASCADADVVLHQDHRGRLGRRQVSRIRPFILAGRGRPRRGRLARARDIFDVDCCSDPRGDHDQLPGAPHHPGAFCGLHAAGSDGVR